MTDATMELKTGSVDVDVGAELVRVLSELVKSELVDDGADDAVSDVVPVEDGKTESDVMAALVVAVTLDIALEASDSIDDRMAEVEMNVPVVSAVKDDMADATDEAIELIAEAFDDDSSLAAGVVEAVVVASDVVDVTTVIKSELDESDSELLEDAEVADADVPPVDNCISTVLGE